MTLDELVKSKNTDVEILRQRYERMWKDLVAEIHEFAKEVKLQIVATEFGLEVEILRMAAKRWTICGRYLRLSWNEAGIQMRTEAMPIGKRYTSLDLLREDIATWYSGNEG